LYPFICGSGLIVLPPLAFERALIQRELPLLSKQPIAQSPHALALEAAGEEVLNKTILVTALITNKVPNIIAKMVDVVIVILFIKQYF
jgi:hypothetical protein